MSNADEIAKLKELLDSGALTPEEYEKEKQKLLDSTSDGSVHYTIPDVPAEPPKKKRGCLIAFLAVICIGALMTWAFSPNDSDSSNIPGSDPLTKIEQTVGQKSALQAAKQYLLSAPFSAQGLITQLEFTGFSNEDATYAVEHCGADWNEQAAKCAKEYMAIGGISKQSLQTQLEVGHHFTAEQAAYGVQSVGY